MLVSFIVPVYNAEKRIRQTVYSLLNVISSDMEIILVNDGSKDNSGEICNELQNKYNSIKVIHQTNQGPSAARNTGMQEAKGEFFSFIDADDSISENWRKVIPEMLRISTSDIIVFGYTAVKKEKNQIKRKNVIPSSRLIKGEYLSKNDLISKLYKQDLLNPLWNKVYRSNLINNRAIKINEMHRLGEDLLFNLEFLLWTEKIEIIEVPLYYYIYNEESLTKSFTKNKFSQLKSVSLEFRDYIKQLNMSEELYYSSLLQNIYSSFLELIKKESDLNFSEKIEEIIRIYNDPTVIELLAKYKPTGYYHKILFCLLKFKNPYFLFGMATIMYIVKFRLLN